MNGVKRKILSNDFFCNKQKFQVREIHVCSREHTTRSKQEVVTEGWFMAPLLQEKSYSISSTIKSSSVTLRKSSYYVLISCHNLTLQKYSL